MLSNPNVFALEYGPSSTDPRVPTRPVIDGATE